MTNDLAPNFELRHFPNIPETKYLFSKNQRLIFDRIITAFLGKLDQSFIEKPIPSNKVKCALKQNVGCLLL